MKLSKKERKLLKREIQQGFMQAWMTESHARKERRRSEPQKAKAGGFHRFAFWKRPAEPVKPVAAVVVVAAGSSN